MKPSAQKAGKKKMPCKTAQLKNRHYKENKMPYKPIKKAAVAGIIGGALAVPAAALAKTLLTPRKVSAYEPKGDPDREKLYAGKLSEMVKYETVSVRGEIQREKFLGFHKVLEELFPLVHKNLEKTEIDGSLMFKWTGKRHDRPIVLMGHQDVVAAEGKWIHEPFSGDIADGKVWGRGSGDTKCSVMAFLQAAEELLAENYVPAQDIYLCSSNTEEIGGEGAPKTVDELERRGVRPFLVCDEGGAIVQEPLAGFPGNYAMVGVLEKGNGNVKVIARSNGGHSSTPSKNSPIARLSRFVCDIEKHNPMKVDLEPELISMFKRIADYGPFYMRFALGNLWLTKPLLKLAGPHLGSEVAALMRTTIAFTQQSGSQGANILPQEASITVNMRFIPHQDKEESIAIIRRIASKYGLEVEDLGGEESYPPVNTEGDAFGLVEKVIADVFPGLPVIPYVMTGGTNAAYYQRICDACIRFSPVLYTAEQMETMHGLNENISTVSLPGAVDFYKTIIKKAE